MLPEPDLKGEVSGSFVYINVALLFLPFYNNMYKQFVYNFKRANSSEITVRNSKSYPKEDRYALRPLSRETRSLAHVSGFVHFIKT